jgi:selenocysteine lyase/cysteine desulfurase
MTEPLAPDAEKLAALRAGLPATGAGIYLDTATRGPLPAESAAAMRDAEEWELRVGRATEGREDDVAQRAAEARAVLAAAVGGDPAEIALMPGLDAALGSAAWAPDWKAGDRALTVTAAGRETFAVLAAIRQRAGVELDLIDKTDVRSVAAAVTPRTRLVVLPHVSPQTGERLPIEVICAALRPSGAWIVVDASCSAGVIPISAQELDTDFIAVAADRWLLAPEGTACLWAGPRALAEARPTLATEAAFETLDGPISRPWPDARRFEATGLPRTTLLGLARSVGWLEMYVGLPWALPRGERLARGLLRTLAATDGVELLTPLDSAAGIATFRLANWRASEAAEELGRRVFAILRPLPELDSLRASVAWFNSEEELARFAEAVAELARHTPDTLPRRPSLTVLGNG